MSAASTTIGTSDYVASDQQFHQRLVELDNFYKYVPSTLLNFWKYNICWTQGTYFSYVQIQVKWQLQLETLKFKAATE